MTLNRQQQRLKEQTADLHERIEQTALMTQLMSPSVSISHYLYTLYVWRAWLLRYQTTIEQHLPNIFKPLMINRLSLITRDLRLLQEKYPSLKVKVEVCQSDISNQYTISSPELALGALYVLEGSALGGQYVSRHIKRALGNDTPCLFYSGQCESSIQTTRDESLEPHSFNVRERWNYFIEQLENYITKQSSPQCSDEVLKGAQSTFESLIDSFVQQDKHSISAQGICATQALQPTPEGQVSWT